MSLDGDRLGTAIANAIIANRPNAGVKMTDNELEVMWQQIATEIVDEFTDSGETSTSIGGGSSAGTYGGTIS